MRNLLILIALALGLWFLYTQVEVYRNVKTDTPAVVVHVPNGEIGYSAGWFYCHKGEC